MPEKDLLTQIEEIFSEDYEEEDAEALAKKIVEAGIDLKSAIDRAAAAIRQVGDAFETGDLFLPDLMIAGKKMELIMGTFKPHLTPDQAANMNAKVAIGTVKGDIHDIGKNLVATQLSVAGFEVADLGVDVPPMDFITAAKEQHATIIAISALMTNSIPYQKEVIDLLTEMGNRDKYYVVVGGGPVSLENASAMGADGWAVNAIQARKVCEKIAAQGDKPPLSKIITPD